MDDITHHFTPMPGMTDGYCSCEAATFMSSREPFLPIIMTAYIAVMAADTRKPRYAETPLGSKNIGIIVRRP